QHGIAQVSNCSERRIGDHEPVVHGLGDVGLEHRCRLLAKDRIPYRADQPPLVERKVHGDQHAQAGAHRARYPLAPRRRVVVIRRGRHVQIDGDSLLEFTPLLLLVAFHRPLPAAEGCLLESWLPSYSRSDATGRRKLRWARRDILQERAPVAQLRGAKDADGLIAAQVSSRPWTWAGGDVASTAVKGSRML